MITYNWTVDTSDFVPQTTEGVNYVFTAHWRCTGTDGTYESQVCGICLFSVESGTNLSPISRFRELQVIDRCWANGVDKDATEATVAQQIQNQIVQAIQEQVAPQLQVASEVKAEE